MVGGSAGTGVGKSVDSDGTEGGGGDGSGNVESENANGGDAPEFHCSYVELDVLSKDVQVTFADGSSVSTFSGAPKTLGSPGRVVSEVTIGETTYENSNTDCDPGEKATTFTCRSVTVGCEEFARSGGTPPDNYVQVELLFADGTTERRNPPTDPTGTFRGTGENDGKLLAEFRLYHEAFRTAHVWRNPRVRVDASAD